MGRAALLTRERRDEHFREALQGGLCEGFSAHLGRLVHLRPAGARPSAAARRTRRGGRGGAALRPRPGHRGHRLRRAEPEGVPCRLPRRPRPAGCATAAGAWWCAAATSSNRCAPSWRKRTPPTSTWRQASAGTRTTASGGCARHWRRTPPPARPRRRDHRRPARRGDPRGLGPLRRLRPVLPPLVRVRPAGCPRRPARCARPPTTSARIRSPRARTSPASRRGSRVAARARAGRGGTPGCGTASTGTANATTPSRTTPPRSSRPICTSAPSPRSNSSTAPAPG